MIDKMNNVSTTINIYSFMVIFHYKLMICLQNQHECRLNILCDNYGELTPLEALVTFVQTSHEIARNDPFQGLEAPQST